MLKHKAHTTQTKAESAMDLIELGWNQELQTAFAELPQESWIPARVFSENRGSYILMSEQGQLLGIISGRFSNSTNKRADFPTVGDWVAAEPDLKQRTAYIHTLLPRHSLFTRKTTGNKTDEQTIAANIDTVFIVTGLDNNFNPKRIERYLTLAWSSNAQPVIILNKADILADSQQKNDIEQALTTIALGVPIHFISAATGDGVVELQQYFTKGSTTALLGSSGAGKSTLINLLLNNTQQKTADVRTEDSKGRHTTTNREMFILPTGGMIIDTPGMRELQLWMDDADLEVGFSDIEALAANCRFSNCGHTTEPGCAVKAAIDNNELKASRLESYYKIKREVNYLATRQQENKRQTRETERKFSKMCREVIKHKHKTKS